ncbi:hypothetical protein ATB98_24730 [Sinorhizobium saheli]|uniref:Uncharacterized protein n=1 Tax=Sinorhizobium saheli TaxID=36856 RepID=A0A178YPT8_SINSA|nr:hypothetical protein ATB98_24730 [Sinorhizobium saheli]
MHALQREGQLKQQTSENIGGSLLISKFVKASLGNTAGIGEQRTFVEIICRAQMDVSSVFGSG